MVQLLCPRCGTVLAGEAIDLAKSIAVCRPCGEIVPLPTRSELVPVDEPLAPARKYRPTTYPFHELELNGAWEARIAGERMSSLPILGFSLFWNAFVTFWIWGAAQASVFFALFGTPFALVGAGMLYRALVGLLNTRSVRIADGTFVVQSGPIPTRGGIHVAVDRIESVTTEVRMSRTRTGWSQRIDYVLNLADGTSLSFDADTTDRAAADYGLDRISAAVRRAKALAPALPYRS